MSSRRSMLDWFRQLPRAGKWAVIGGTVLVLLLAWDELSTMTARWDDEATRLLAEMDHAAGRAQRERLLLQMEDTIRGIGTVSPPRTEKVAEDAFYDLIAEVVKGHTVSNDSFNYRGATKMPRGTLSSILGPGQSLERVSGDLRFDATPETGIAVIAALEKSPQIESITTVRITTGAGPRKVTVDISMDAWIISGGRGAATRGGPA